MLYAIPVVCFLAAWLMRRRNAQKRLLIPWIALMYLAMLTQTAVLLLSGTWSLKTGLPLHLCGFAGVLSAALVSPSPAMLRFYRRAAAPGALLALLFPAAPPLAFPRAYAISFFLLHALLAALPLLLPTMRGGATGMYRLCLALLLPAVAANELFGANYLFLRALPSGTPFAMLNSLPRATLPLLAAALAYALSYAKMPLLWKKTGDSGV